MGRSAHHEMPDVVSRISDPFSEEGYQAFINLWNRGLTGPDGKPTGVTRLAYRIYRARVDVQQAMPDIFGGDLLRFLKWALSSGRAEHNLSDVFVAPISNAIKLKEKQADSDPGRRQPANPLVNERVHAALARSGIWLNAGQVPVQVEALNVLIGNGNAKAAFEHPCQGDLRIASGLAEILPGPLRTRQCPLPVMVLDLWRARIQARRSVDFSIEETMGRGRWIVGESTAEGLVPVRPPDNGTIRQKPRKCEEIAV
jgi:hypothetical protein